VFLCNRVLIFVQPRQDKVALEGTEHPQSSIARKAIRCSLCLTGHAAPILLFDQESIHRRPNLDIYARPRCYARACAWNFELCIVSRNSSVN
jgi:hypothetical protein